MTALSGFLAFTLLQCIVICAVFVALCDLCKRAFGLDDLLTFCATVFLLGVLGYLAFWLAFASYPVFGKAKIVLLAALLARFGWIVYRRRLRDYRWLAEPLLFTVLFFLVVLTLAFSAGGIDDPATTAQNRFSEPLPPDNIIPYMVAMALQAGHIPSPLAGDWVASDRPPLQTGLYLLLALNNHPVAYQIVTPFLQATYLFGVWGLAAAAGLSTAARRLVLLACCLLPTAIINTFFTWPKMLAVPYLLLVFVLLFCRKPEGDTERKAAGILIGGLAGLAVLSHGSSAFVLIGLAVAVLAFWNWPPLKSMIYGAATLIVLYVPWMLFQNFIDPPGNRLLKWHLAGVRAVDSRGLLAALRDEYGALSWHDYVQGRLINITTMIGSWPHDLADIAATVARQDAGQAVRVRYDDFFMLLPSLHYFSIALICALALLAFMNGEQRVQRRIAVRLLMAVAANCAALVILIFIPGQTINHVGSYATQVMLTAFAFMVLALRAPALAIVFIAAQAVSVATMYAFTLPHDAAYWPLWLICAAAAAAIFGYTFYPRFVSLKPSPPSAPGVATAARR